MSDNSIAQAIATELNITLKSVLAVIALLDEGGTVPFIARYRKEQTGSLDEVQIMAIRDRNIQIKELIKRKESILKSIGEQGKLTPELEQKIDKAATMALLEDIYLPYKPKRRTKSTIAKEKGLEPLALWILEQNNDDVDNQANTFINLEKEVTNIEEALTGARDIIAEIVSENAEVRSQLRHHFAQKGLIKSKVISGKEIEAAKYKDYFECSELIKNVPSHRMLAMRRAEKEGFLILDIVPEEEVAIDLIHRNIITQGANNQAKKQVSMAITDGYKRLLRPSIESDTRIKFKLTADDEAIRVFADNIKQLLLSSPLGQKKVLAIDPGFRTGCKVVALDSQGSLLKNTVIYPEQNNRKAEAEHILKTWCKEFEIEAIAIGNGTGGRETETFIKTLGLPKEIAIVMVNESGASIYSASEVAREEFPNEDITVRGAVSIGRRLMDPLAELVKIDPKSIGVGQYQHDVDQNKLKTCLDDVVSSAVNSVGVELNTASKQLLTYVSGLGPNLAENIIKYRTENGPFKSRSELKKVARMGEKAFEQAAGFLRIRNAKNPLDSSAVHPERYSLVEKMSKDLGCTLADLIQKSDLRSKIDLKKYVSTEVGLPTLTDIVKELEKPGRDPREQFEAFSYADGINKPEDLRIGMKLKGVVTNITNFGAFVDIGVHQDGLVHVSHMADRFITDPNQVVKLQQKVEVTVMELDLSRKRISLSMKQGAPTPQKTKQKTEVESVSNTSMADQLNALKNKFK